MTHRLGIVVSFVALSQLACATACTSQRGGAGPAASEGPAQAVQPGQVYGAPMGAGPSTTVSPDRAARVLEAGEWIDSAAKKLNRDDGPGCLADLDRARALDEKTEARAVGTRSMCEMAAGQCQLGKQHAEAWQRENVRLAPEHITKSVEAMAAMYCRGGDMTPRDQLLQAVFELTQGAYMTTKEPAWCSARIAKIRQLSAMVMPRDERDDQVKNAMDVACTAGPTCLGRARDCRAAFNAFAQPDCRIPQNLVKVSDPVARQNALVQGFESVVSDCKRTP